MPRREINNPSIRIQQLLEEVAELEAAYDTISALAAELLPAEQFERLPPKPRLEAIINERARQQFTSARVRSAREAARRKRLLYEEGATRALEDYLKRPTASRAHEPES